MYGYQMIKKLKMKSENVFEFQEGTLYPILHKLEENGLIKTERTNGKFVTEDKNIINKIKNDYADNLTQNYLSEMISLGITKQEIKERIK